MLDRADMVEPCSVAATKGPIVNAAWTSVDQASDLLQHNLLEEYQWPQRVHERTVLMVKIAW